jgi:hypothetical protein
MTEDMAVFYPPRPPLPWLGGCRCGAVRFKVTGPPILTMACHCTGCQRMTGGAYSLSILLRAETFEVTAGKPVIGGMGGDVRHFHCPRCLSWMFTRPPGLDWLINLRSPMLDDGAAAAFPPFVETYTSEMLPWAATGAPRSYPKFPTQEEYGGLVAEFAEREGEGAGEA